MHKRCVHLTRKSPKIVHTCVLLAVRAALHSSCVANRKMFLCEVCACAPRSSRTRLDFKWFGTVYAASDIHKKCINFQFSRTQTHTFRFRSSLLAANAFYFEICVITTVVSTHHMRHADILTAKWKFTTPAHLPTEATRDPFTLNHVLYGTQPGDDTFVHYEATKITV